MSYWITDPCMGTKDTACVEVCPVDCIHPTKDDPDFDARKKLFIDPETCIDCSACEPVCPVNAIYADEDLPSSQEEFKEIDALYYSDPDAADNKVEEHMENCNICKTHEPKDRHAHH